MSTDNLKSIEVQTKVLGELRARVDLVFFLGGVADTGVPSTLIGMLCDMENEDVVTLFGSKMASDVAAAINETEDEDEFEDVVRGWLTSGAGPRGFVLLVEAPVKDSWGYTQLFRAYGESFEEALCAVVEAVGAWRDAGSN